MIKTPEQLKGAIRNVSREKNIHAQEVLQIFMFERIIERLSCSKYRKQFILKGGLLIASIIGISQRTTLDMDTTVKGLPVTEEKIYEVIEEILSTPLEDGVAFRITGIKPIREADAYDNFRVSLQAEYGKMNIPMKIDITTGDEITPRETEYPYPCLFEDKTIPVMAYTKETILAEKYETIIRRDVSNTRARDYYDLQVLFNLYRSEANWKVLKEAVDATAKKRGSSSKLEMADEVIAAIANSSQLKQLWENYQRENAYAKDISFEDVTDTVREFSSKLRVG